LFSVLSRCSTGVCAQSRCERETACGVPERWFGLPPSDRTPSLWLIVSTCGEPEEPLEELSELDEDTLLLLAVASINGEA
jgi:hypothetical protein